jgi:hypothetical protein
MTFEATLCILALLVSAIALLVSFLAKRQARNLGLLSNRLQVINHVRHALYDVAIRGRVRLETATSLGNARQLASIVFSTLIRQALDEAHKLALHLHSVPADQQKEKYREDKDRLIDSLKEIHEAMVKETTGELVRSALSGSNALSSLGIGKMRRRLSWKPNGG